METVWQGRRLDRRAQAAPCLQQPLLSEAEPWMVSAQRRSHPQSDPGRSSKTRPGRWLWPISSHRSVHRHIEQLARHQREQAKAADLTGVVPAFQLQETIEGEYEEADLIEDWCIDRVLEAGVRRRVAG